MNYLPGTRYKANKIKNQGFETVGTVIGYENKFVRVAGSYTWLDYPTVKYTDQNDKESIGFIKYAKSSGRYFSVGQEVEIIIHDNTIYYKHAIDFGILRPVSIALLIIGICYELFKP